ncbi:MAG: transglutaminase family protein [Pseudomonadota bacterium]
MNPRLACLACLEHDPPAVFEAALWIAAEHAPEVQPALLMRQLDTLQQQVAAGLPAVNGAELAQLLLRRLHDLGFHKDEEQSPGPQAALLHRVLQSKRGQPLSLALIALELARRLQIPLLGVNFPGHFLLRAPGADHLLDPCSGRRLYTRDCRELLQRQLGAQAELNAAHLHSCDARSLLQRLSRNLRHLYQQEGDYLCALIDAERVLQLGPPTAVDHLARAELYQQLACPQAERYDLQHALLLTDDLSLRLQLQQRLRRLSPSPALH